MAATQTPASPAGWYHDPTGHSTLRYWSGAQWTTWVHDTSGTHPDPLGWGPRLGPEDLEHLAFIRRVFLPEARRLGYVSPREDANLEALVTSMRTRAGADAGAPVSPAARPAAPRLAAPSVPSWVPRVSTGAPAPTTRPTPPPTERPTRVERPTPAAARWWHRARERVGSDLAVHGLAYAGVLLFFVGAFGLVVFAFGDVAPRLRPLAEAVIACLPFAAAALLVRRGAVVVGRAVEVVGGLLLPVMVVTSFLDGVGMPPDLEGSALVVALTSLLALVSLAYAGWSARHPASALRYLVAPVAWLAVAMAALGLGPRGIPSGKDVATPTSWQVAVVALAVVLSLALCRWRPDARLAAPTRLAAVPGLGVVALLGLLGWTAEGWPALPSLLTGAVVLVGLDLLGDRVPQAVPGVVGPLWWAVVTAGTLASTATAGDPRDVAAVAVMAAAGFLAQLERSAMARRSLPALALPGAGTLVALGPTWVDPWWAAAAFAALALWAGVRRAAPPPALLPGAVLLDVVAAGAPLVALGALLQATDPATVLAAAAGLTLLAALVPRVATRTREPGLWTVWALAVGGAALLAATGATAEAAAMAPQEQWTVVTALAVLTVTAVVVPLVAVARPPAVTATATVTALWVVTTLEVAPVATVAVLGGAALGLVVLAHLWHEAEPGVATSAGLTGHALATFVVALVAFDGWALVVALTGWTAGMATTASLGALGRSPVLASLDRYRLGWAAAALTAAGLPMTIALALDSGAVLALENPWQVVVPAAAALGYATLTRSPLPRRERTVAAWSAYAAALAAVLVPQEVLPSAVGFATVSAAVALVRADRRHPVMTWTAWLALAPAVGLLAHGAWPRLAESADALEAALAALVVGGALLVGGAAADLRGRAWQPRWRPVHPWALAPVVIGFVEVVAARIVSLVLPTGQAGWVWTGAAGVMVATVVLSRFGLLAAPTAAVGWIAVVLLVPEPVRSASWVHLVVVGVLLAAAEALNRLGDHDPWWARADLPVLAVAGPVSVAALAVSLGTDSQDWTFVVVGALLLLVAARLHRVRILAGGLAGLGAVLVLVGAATAGSGWLALALAATSAALTAAAVMTSGPVRTVAQVGGALAAVGSWTAAADWLALGDQRLVDATVAGAGAVSLVAATAAVRRWTDRSWVLVWGGTAAGLAALGGLAAAIGSPPLESWWVAGGLLAVAAALALGSAPVALLRLRELSALYVLGAVGVGLRVADADVGRQVGVLAVLSLGTAVALLALHVSDRARGWTGTGLVLGGVGTAWCLALAASGPTDTLLLVPALGAAAVQSGVAGIVLDRALLRMAAPVLACGAWLAFALEALDGNPQWVTVPVGLAVLAVVGLWRRDRRRAGSTMNPPEVVGLEGVGVAFLVGSALVQSVTEALWYALVVSAVGLAVAGWGVLTRVRRRLVTGVALGILGVVVLVAVPLVHLLPAWEGAALWVLVGGVGLALVLVATMLERGRAAVRAGNRRLHALTQGWE